jgi:hypothetical protein
MKNDNQHPIQNEINEEITLLKKRIEKLSFICEEINPFNELNDEQKDLLQSVGILDFSNPFHITNTLVVLLEDSIEKLHLLNPNSNPELNTQLNANKDILKNDNH